MSDVCKCGHAKKRHRGRWSDCRDCGCDEFTQAAADRDDLAAILAKHTLVHFYCYNCGAGPFFGDHGKAGDDAHRAHVAQMVLESDWLRDELTKERSRIAFQFIGAWGGRIGGVTGQRLIQEIVDWINNGADNTTDRT